MKKRIFKIAACLGIAALLMFAEYRFIMKNARVYTGAGNTVQIEVFGMVDEYAAEFIG